MSKEVDELVAALVDEFSGPSGKGCWATKLEPEPTEFLAKVREVESTGRKIRRSVVAKTLSDQFGVNIGTDALRRHLLGNCSCE